MRLPFSDESFDCAVMHLIVAMVPEPSRCLAETAQVLKRGGMLLVLDKFLRPGEAAPLRRALNPIANSFATRLDVVWEDLLAAVPKIAVQSDEPEELIERLRDHVVAYHGETDEGRILERLIMARGRIRASDAAAR